MPHPGQQITSTIRLVGLLGQGGMGSVWVAVHQALGTEVAVKFIAPWCLDDEQAVARFRREAQMIARVKSPHVAAVFDYGIMPDGQPYIVMELLVGETLQERLKTGDPLPVNMVVRIVEQTAMALEAAHALGVVHRDIKPANLFLMNVGGQPFVKVLDFGIAKLLESGGSFTTTGDPIGTPLYMSPEQFQDPKGVDHRTDLWSLGVVAYESFTGDRPFQGATIFMLAFAITKGVFKRLTACRLDLPESVNAWMTKALAPDIEARFTSARAMADALVAAFKRVVVVPEDFGTVDTPGLRLFSPLPPRAISHAPHVTALSFIGSLADKALAMGRVDEAERILQRILDSMLTKTHTNQLSALDTASTAAKYALTAFDNRRTWSQLSILPRPPRSMR
jgi:eukaryotic-like serine/threonine-protein kinase